MALVENVKVGDDIHWHLTNRNDEFNATFKVAAINQNDTYDYHSFVNYSNFANRYFTSNLKTL